MLSVVSASAQGTHEWLVNSDGDDSGGCPQQCTLRAAIEAANASEGGDRIRFARGMTIRPQSWLPALATADIAIDASDLGGGVDQVPQVWLQGAEAGDAAGIEITAARAQVRGLGISGFQRYGVGVVGAGAVDALIEGNWIGLSSDGRRAEPNRLSGVAVVGGAAGARIVGNRIGGNSVTARTGHGIVVGGGGSINAELIENVIGIGIDGSALPNDDGILIVDSGHATVRGNVIGFSAVAGIEVRETRIPIDISSNWVGVQRSGETAANDVGIFLGPGSAAVRVGASAANVIAGNRVGIAVEQGARDAELWNNWIGLVPRGGSMSSTDLPRARVLPNAERGISIIADAANTLVVNNLVAAGNYGIVVANAHTVSLIRNVVAGARNGRTQVGIDVRAGTGVEIGGKRGLGNDICRNDVCGNDICGAEVAVRLAMIEEAQVLRNRIGPDVAERVRFDSDDRMDTGIELGAGVVRTKVQQNQIAGAAGAGIAVTGRNARDNELTQNAYTGNGIDIDLGGDGPTRNDPGDVDSGPHGLLNYPILESHTVIQKGNQLHSTFSGTAQPGAHVQLYVLDGSRMNPFAQTIRPADLNGRWEAVSLELPTGSIRALAISRTRATSEFSPPWEPTRRVKVRSGVSYLVWRGADTSIEQAFAGRFAEALETVWRWDAASQDWQGWAPNVPGAELTRVRHGDVLTVEFRQGVPENFFMPPRGAAGERGAAVWLYEGLNEVSWLAGPVDGVEALTALDRAQPRLLSVVWQWDDRQGRWRVVWPRLSASWTPPRWTADGSVRLWIRASRSELWLQWP